MKVKTKETMWSTAVEEKMESQGRISRSGSNYSKVRGSRFQMRMVLGAKIREGRSSFMWKRSCVYKRILKSFQRKDFITWFYYLPSIGCSWPVRPAKLLL